MTAIEIKKEFDISLKTITQLRQKGVLTYTTFIGYNNIVQYDYDYTQCWLYFNGFRELEEEQSVNTPPIYFQENPYKKLYYNEIKKEIKGYLEKLKERNERYAFCVENHEMYGYTYEEIGKILGVSRERVRQMVAKGLRIMRKYISKTPTYLLHSYYNK